MLAIASLTLLMRFAKLVRRNLVMCDFSCQPSKALLHRRGGRLLDQLTGSDSMIKFFKCLRKFMQKLITVLRVVGEHQVNDRRGEDSALLHFADIEALGDRGL